MKLLLLMLAAAGSVFFLVRGFQLQAGYRNLSQIEVKRAELEEARAREEKTTPIERLRAYLRKQGWEGDLFPFVAAMGFLYLLLLVVLRVVNVPYEIGALLALPGSAGVAWTVAAAAARQRRRRFNYQLTELLELVASQIESGNGAQKALQTVVPNMQEPLRTEMNKVLDAQVASKDLIGSMRELADRYPSRAMSMFIAALEIDRAEGQAIGPALHQSAELLKRDFALAAEAGAEISQTRGEFFAVIGIMGGISVYMIFSGDETSRAAYTSFAGLAIVAVGFANVLVGVWRFLRLLNNARGDS